MCNYWVNFIKTGNPNGLDDDRSPLPEWFPYTHTTPFEMVFTTQGAKPVQEEEKPFMKFMMETIVRQLEGSSRETNRETK